MKKRLHVVILLAAFVMVTTNADASGKPRRTVADLLTSCSKSDGASQSECNRPIHASIMAESFMQQPMGAGRTICLPNSPDVAKVRAAILVWLSNKPQLESVRESDGVTAALESLYPCS